MLTKDRNRAKEKKGLQRPWARTSVTPFEDMERLFEDFGQRGWLHPFRWEWPRDMATLGAFEGQMPNVDLIDREKEVIVRAELPGVEKDDLEVTMTDHSVTIKACTRHEEKEEEGEYYRQEITCGDYQRTLELPEGVDVNKAKAKFRNGILKLKIPKTKPAKRERITVE